MEKESNMCVCVSRKCRSIDASKWRPTDDDETNREWRERERECGERERKRELHDSD